MVRAPCCEKMGLKKGPWTPEEDQILISYIQRHGHGNWRALPKQAGLLRCGKSCRLRWTNYLRPDIKRGNFSIEEEDTIIKLHEMLGNRWSAIAARLPGRTDNEIKNVWHTHLKKRLKQNPPSMVERSESEIEVKGCSKESKHSKFTTDQDVESSVYVPASPHQSSSDFSSGTDQSTTTAETCAMATKEEQISETDETLCSEALSADNTWMPDEFLATTAVPQLQLPLSPSASYRDENMDFWFNLFIRADDLPELPEF